MTMRFVPIGPLLAASTLFLGGCHAAVGLAPPGQMAHDHVQNVIFLVADGAGAGLWTAARYAQEDLAVERMPVVGLVDTRSGSHKVTDSAAGATAFATGERVRNRTIAVAPACPGVESNDTTRVWPAACEPIETWFQIARDRGKATGVVTTTDVVDATPAAFVAHAPSRYWHEDIAVDFVEFGLDALLGGGQRHFAANTRRDGVDLLGRLCRQANCIETADELAAYRADDRPLVGLFAPGDLDDLDKQPVHLPEMVEAALAKLGQSSGGFVALIETESTDNSTHANAPLERITADILEFDRAVAVALNFAAQAPGTLVIAVGDHETGGLSLAETGTDFELRYTTEGHSAALVPIFASGPQADRFGGLIDNSEIGRILLEIARGW